MAAGNAIRGSRIGAGPMGESERGDSAPRTRIDYYCAHGHVTRPAFAVDAEIPDQWECVRCGLPAGTDADNPPPIPKTAVYKTHLAYVKERRTEEEATAILQEALASLRERRAAGEVIY